MEKKEKVESYDEKVSTRLRDVLDNDFSNRKEASIVSGKSEDTLLNYLNGKYIPTLDVIIKLLNYKGINLDWLVYGKGEKYIKNNVKVGKGSQKISIYDVSLSAGNGWLADEENIQFTITISKELVEAFELSSHCVGAYIKGDSMMPKLSNGDIAIIDRSVDQFEDDGIYAFNYDKHCYIKQLQRIGKEMKVKSINPEYESWSFSLDEDFNIVGKLKMIISKQ
ncbi:MAG: S24 family peptidase [Alphaproteobacteria bacterium]